MGAQKIYLSGSSKLVEPADLPDAIKGKISPDTLRASVPDIYVDEKELAERDFIYMVNYLVHGEVANDNKFKFKTKDLRDVWLTPDRPLVVDLNHMNAPAVGVSIYGGLNFDEDANADGLIVYSVIFAWGPYKDVAKEIIELAQKDQLRFSMECTCEYTECETCGALAKEGKPEQYCTHLRAPIESRGVMIIRHPTFLCNSIIIPPRIPADRWARGLMLANLIEDPESWKTRLLESFKNQENQHKVAIKAEGIMERELQEKIAKLQADLDAANALNADLTSKLAEKDQTIADLTAAAEAAKTLEEQVAALTAECEALKSKVSEYEAKEKQAQVDARVGEITAMGLELTDDEFALVKHEAETKDEAAWKAYVSMVTKLSSNQTKKADAELEASQVVGNIPNLSAESVDAMNKLRNHLLAKKG